MRNTVHSEVLLTCCVLSVGLALRCYNELSEHDPFYIPHTNIPCGQTKLSNQENADRLILGGEENAYEKEWSMI